MKAKIKYDYYMHRNMCFIDNYFGEIGKPFKVSIITYYIMKWLGYRATKVFRGASLSEVMTKAAIDSGADPNSHFVKKQSKIKHTNG